MIPWLQAAPANKRKGEIFRILYLSAHLDNRQPLEKAKLLKKYSVKIYGDKGYIEKEFMQMFFVDGIHLVTQIKNNIKNQLMTMTDKILLRKCSLIETVNDELKNVCQIEHSRYRSIINFVAKSPIEDY